MWRAIAPHYKTLRIQAFISEKPGVFHTKLTLKVKNDQKVD